MRALLGREVDLQTYHCQGAQLENLFQLLDRGQSPHYGPQLHEKLLHFGVDRKEFLLLPGFLNPEVLEVGGPLGGQCLLAALDEVLAVGGLLVLAVDLEDAPPPFEEVEGEQDCVPEEEAVGQLGLGALAEEDQALGDLVDCGCHVLDLLVAVLVLHEVGVAEVEVLDGLEAELLLLVGDGRDEAGAEAGENDLVEGGQVLEESLPGPEDLGEVVAVRLGRGAPEVKYVPNQLDRNVREGLLDEVGVLDVEILKDLDGISATFLLPGH